MSPRTPRPRRIIAPVDGIDLDFRPTSYCADASPVAAIVQNIAGENRRTVVAGALVTPDAAGAGPIPDAFLADLVPDDLRAGLGRHHPTWLGGEYLPHYDVGEFEIARLVLRSTTQDVFSLRARRRTPHAPYRYRMVDEYESTFDLPRRTSTRPLTLRQVIALIDGITSDNVDTRGQPFPEGFVWWQLHEYGETPEEAAGFVRVRSEVYPQMEAYYEERLVEWARGERGEGEEEE